MTEEAMRSCQAQLRKKDADLEQVELLLHKMYQLAEQSMQSGNDEQIDRQQLQAEMERVKENVEQILASLREESNIEGAYDEL